MKFTLIHYTEEWRIGATVELDATPQPGTLVKSSLDSPENYSDIYYVDNILWGEGGDNYIFARPYNGYGRKAPLTEIDRVDATLEEIQTAVGDLAMAIDTLNDNIMSKLEKIL